MSVTAAAVLCALVNSLSGSRGMAGAVLKMVTGLVMAAVILGPLEKHWDLDLNRRFQELDQQVSAAVAKGEEISQNALRQRIKQETEAYILDKAARLGLTLEVRVDLSDDDLPVPVGVTLRGAVSPAARAELEAMIRQDLGIGKEGQVWV
ncbi:MAG: hypothetical protein IKC09_00630 [Oscillospiraceae bacterium]|nr:hypothetical protein [Oscillospiraceae bacterium]